jgi:hypothetical protein
LTATIEGNKIHMPLGQYTEYYEDEGCGDIYAWGTIVPDSNGEGAQFVQDNTVTEVTFTIQDGVITIDNTSGGNDGIGAVGLAEITDDGDYCYYVEWNSTFTPFTEPTVIYEQPEGVLVTYTRNNQGINYNEQELSDITYDFNVVYAPDGQTAYVQDPVCVIPTGAWVEGTVNNNKITVPLGQCIYYEDGFGVITAWGTNTYSEYGYHQFTPDYSVTSVTYTIDDEGYVTIDNSQAGTNGSGATGVALTIMDGSYCFAMEWNAPEPPTAITEQPEGILEQYVRHGNWIYESGSVIPVDGLMDVVFAPDKTTVYIKDPISYSQNGTWVMGTMEDGIITVPVGQLLSTEGKYNTIFAFGKMALSQTTWQYEFTPLYDKTAIQYYIDGDTIYLMDGWNSGPVYEGPAAMQDGTYYAQGVEYEAYYTLYDGPTVITNQPNGNLVTYQRTGSGFYRNEELSKKGDRYIYAPDIKEQGDVVNVVYAPDGQTVYLQDPVYCGYQYNRGTWVRGTISGDKIHVPLGQYVSWDMYYETGDVLVWGSTTLQDYYGDLELEFTPDPNVTEVTYTIANGCISLDNSSGGSYIDYQALHDQYYNGEFDDATYEQLVAPMFATTGLAYVTMDGYWNDEMSWGTVYVGKHPTTLPDPEIYGWYDYNNENGNNRLEVAMPTVDIDGLPIFEDALSYSIYTDRDKIFTFEASKYGLDEDVTEVTYDMWENFWRLNPYAGIRFYRTNADGYEPFFNWRIGIQFHYTVDGVKTSTNIVYLEVFEEPNDDIPGDVDGSGNVDIDDVTQMISHVLGDASQPSFINANADLNGDHSIDIDDVTIAINKVLGNN